MTPKYCLKINLFTYFSTKACHNELDTIKEKFEKSSYSTQARNEH